MTASLKFDFTAKRVLITGGTSGMGEACARSFAAAGAHVVINGRNHDRARAIITACKRGPGSIAFVEGDIGSRKKCDLIITEAVGILGGLDIVVNSAGVIFHATVEETTDEQWLQTMNVNVNGMFYICRAAMPQLRSSKGTIINIASDAALSGSRHMVAYCASKGAVLQMTRAMALDQGPEGIRIVPVCPGDVDTPMLRGEFNDRGLDAKAGLHESAESVPLKRVCSAQEVADMTEYEMSLMDRYSDWYGYEFFVFRRAD